MKYKRLRKIYFREYCRELLQIIKFCFKESSILFIVMIIAASAICLAISKEFDFLRSVIAGIMTSLSADFILYFKMKSMYIENQRRMDALLTGKAILDMTEEELDELDELTKEAEQLEEVLYPFPLKNNF